MDIRIKWYKELPGHWLQLEAKEGMRHTGIDT